MVTLSRIIRKKTAEPGRTGACLSFRTESRPMRDFRWVAAIALWTMLSGPIFVRLAVSTATGTAGSAPAAVQKASPSK